MNRCVGPLLWLGLGLCAASGCALSAPSRTSGLGQKISLRDRPAARGPSSVRGETSASPVEVRETRADRDTPAQGVAPFRSLVRSESSLHESPLDDPAQQHVPKIVPGPSRREIIASKKTRTGTAAGQTTPSERGLEPSRLAISSRDSTATAPSLAGHSSDQTNGAVMSGLPERSRANSGRSRQAGSITRADYEVVEADQPPFNTDALVEGSRSATTRSAEQPLITPAVAWTEQFRPDANVGSGVRTANYHSDQDARDNPVTLQGFEAIAPLASAIVTANPNDPPPWGSRPSAGSPVQRGLPLDHGSALSSHGASRIPDGVHRSPPSDTLLAPQSDVRGVGPRVQSINAHAAPPLPPSPWQSEVDQLIARIEHELKGMSPGSSVAAQAEYRRRQVHLKLLHLIAHRPEQALTAIPGLDASEQEYWQQLCWAASNSLDAEQFPSPRDRATQSIAPLNTALRRLREQADLSIKNTAFCEQISYFGNYQKFARDEFTPGQEVLLYAEIENFNTEQTADGEHRTLLRSVIDIIGANGQTRWHKTFPATEDRCRNPRRDYFHNYQFAIPDRLPLGPHTLKLTVVDDLSGKQASYSLRFLVK